MPNVWEHARRFLQRIPRQAVLLCLSGVLTIYLWTLGLPGIDTLPAWFYRTQTKLSLGPAYFVLLACAAPWVIRYALARADEGRTERALALFMSVGAALQFTLHFLVPEGLSQSIRRLHAGHGEFIRIAAERRGHFFETLLDYEALFVDGKLGAFAGSKPPGTLAFYMLLDAIAQWPLVRAFVLPLSTLVAAAHEPANVVDSIALIMLLFPLLTYATLAPLVSTATSLYGSIRAAWAAALLYLTAPAILLIDLHADGALYPLLGMSSIALSVSGVQRRSATRAFLGGALGSLGVYCTFGLLPCLLLAFLFSLILALRDDSSEPLHSRACPRKLTAVSWMVLGAVVTMFLALTALRFDLVYRFRYALAYHTAWQGGNPTGLWRALSLLQFSLYAGVPLMLAFSIGNASALRDLPRRNVGALWTLAITSMLLVLAIAQGTNEVARLWLFAIPLIAIAVAERFIVRANDATTLHAIAVVQAITALFMKLRQPW